MTALLRSLLYALIFYPLTVVWCLAGIVAGLFGRRPTLAIVLSWVEVHHWLLNRVLAIHVRAEGDIPAGPHLIAVKHQSMLETLEMVRLTHLPVISSAARPVSVAQVRPGVQLALQVVEQPAGREDRRNTDP